MRVPEVPDGHLLAAGTPWFMTVFGRDTLISSLQTLLLGPDLAAGTLRVLAATQATADDPERDAEPGKIVHELRRGKAALAWTDRYYGTVDATPLFLVLLSEVWRWTDDPTLPLELEDAARRALAWIDGPADLDGDGFVEYDRRSSHGIRNQTWKDSEDSMAFHDGTLALPPIAPVEVQGYVYDAKLRIAEIARELWRDEALAERLEREAAELRRRFDEAFWLEERGFYALGLDREKRPIDSLTSNLGHLLWSGIVPEHRRETIAGLLMGDALWSGWGIRTMAAGEGAYNPLVYHDGTVWPHDNSLVAWGLAQSGRSARCGSHPRGDGRGCDALRLPPARGLRRLRPRPHRLPRRLSDGLVAAGLGRRRLLFFCSRRCSASCPTEPSGCFAPTRRACRTGWRVSRSRASARSAVAGRCASRTEQ